MDQEECYGRLPATTQLQPIVLGGNTSLNIKIVFNFQKEDRNLQFYMAKYQGRCIKATWTKPKWVGSQVGGGDGCGRGPW